MKSEFWTLGIRWCGAEISGREVIEGCFSVLREFPGCKAKKKPKQRPPLS